MDINQRINRMTMSVQAAQEFSTSRLTAYMAALKVSPAHIREEARLAAVASYEALLDLYAQQARLLLEIQNIDPRFREGA